MSRKITKSKDQQTFAKLRYVCGKMNFSMRLLYVMAGWLLAFSSLGFAQIPVIEIEGEISPKISLFVQRAIREAEKTNPELIIFKINTLGGTLTDAISIRKSISNTTHKTIAFIQDNAASAGVIIAMSCRKIYMSPNSTMGAATPLVYSTGQAASEKMTSYVRSILRASASLNGKNPQVAEAMVGSLQNMYKVTSLTAKEAVNLQVADGIALDINHLLALQQLPDAEISLFKPGWQEALIAFALKPWVSAVLLVLMIIGFKLELTMPGFGLPGVAALICGAFYFIPHQLYGLAEYWEIAVFGLGVLLILLEVFVVPGFGITGISGILLTACGVALVMLGNDGLNFDMVELNEIIEVSTLVVAALIIFGVSIFFLLPKILQSKAMGQISLQTSLDKEEGYTSDFKSDELVGREGSALTVLRPSGKVTIGSAYYDALADGDFIEKGTRIIVVERSGNFLKVRKLS